MQGLFLIVLGALLVVVIIWEFNKFVELKNKVKHSRSSIDIYLNQRFDLIPNLNSCVKGYMNHEAETLAKMSIARIQFAKAPDLKLGASLTHDFYRIMGIAENYPELKANEHFLMLQKELVKMENQLQAARRLYNGDVTIYNTAISTFPSVIISKIFGFKEMELFEIEEYKKENIDINI